MTKVKKVSYSAFLKGLFTCAMVRILWLQPSKAWLWKIFISCGYFRWPSSFISTYHRSDSKENWSRQQTAAEATRQKCHIYFVFCNKEKDSVKRIKDLKKDFNSFNSFDRFKRIWRFLSLFDLFCHVFWNDNSWKVLKSEKWIIWVLKKYSKHVLSHFFCTN